MQPTQLKFAHTGDWHLLDMQYGRRDRAVDFAKAAFSVVEAAHAHGCRIIVNSGDIFHKRTISSSLLGTLAQINKALADRGMTMVVISGNHDLTEPSWFTTFQKLLKELGHETSIVPVHKQLITLEGFSFYGVDFCGPDIFGEEMKAVPPCDVLLVHEAIAEICNAPTNRTIKAQEVIPLERCAYLAAADIHIPALAQVNTPFGVTTLAMPGSIEMVSGGEPLDKSIFVVTLEKVPGSRAHVADLQTVALPKQRPVIPLHIANENDMVSALDKLRAAAQSGQSPIVLLRFDPNVNDVRSRINMALAGTNAIIRTAGYDDAMKGARAIGRHMSVSASQEHDDALRRILGALVPADAPYRAVAEQLLATPDEASSVIDGYIEKRLLSPAQLQTAQ